jgi:hypothetical protein
MPEFLKAPFVGGPNVLPQEVLLRLCLALVLGGAVAWIHRRTRGADSSASFTTTLVLLSILIAMVTQVIGDNVARAFSLVGALSIVRFRTVVRDTQDTAYVIFSVVVGMAVGASDVWVGVIGIGVVGGAAWYMSRRRTANGPDAESPFRLNLRCGIGHDSEALVGPLFDEHLLRRELVSISTARQGVALDLLYDVRLRPGASGEALVRALNRAEGVQAVEFRRHDSDSD